MADKPDEQTDNPFGQELDDSIKANTALLNGLLYDYGQQMAEAQQSGGDMPAPFDLAQLKKLEGQLQNDKLFAEARQLTRKRAAQRQR